VLADQRVDHALLGRELGARLHVLALSLPRLRDGGLDEIAHDLLDVAPDIADLGELGRFDLDEGAPASLARRREISVLPTPVGPIIRMFLGNTSSRSFSSSFRRRQRLRSAIATARLASAWPMMKRSSSETISRGEKSVMRAVFGPAGVRAQWRLLGRQSFSSVTLRLV
jgi:hypothetical protein